MWVQGSEFQKRVFVFRITTRHFGASRGLVPCYSERLYNVYAFILLLRLQTLTLSIKISAGLGVAAAGEEVKLARARNDQNQDMRGSPPRPSVPRAVSWLPGQILANPLERDEEETSSERRRGQTWAVLPPTVFPGCWGRGPAMCWTLKGEW